MTKTEKMLLIPLVVLACVCSLLIGLLIGGRNNRPIVPEAGEQTVEPTVKPVAPTEPPKTEEEDTDTPNVPETPTEPVKPSEPSEGLHHVDIPDDAVPGGEGDVMTDDQVIVDLDTMPAMYVRYTTASMLNVRSAPGTEYDVLDMIAKGTKVEVLNVYDDWSFIRYDGKFGYVSNQYLSEKAVENPTPSVKPGKEGGAGRLYIPSLGVSVALYNTFDQATVDRADSAAILYSNQGNYGMDIVGDHVHQGFAAMRSSVPGKTILKIVKNGVETEYICTDNFRGYNKDYERVDENGNTYIEGDLTDMNGVSIKGRNNGGLCLYTCNSDQGSNTITLTFWQKQ